MKTHTLRAGAFAALLAPSVFAQQVHDGIRLTFEWPIPAGPGTVTKVEAGQVASDVLPDLLVQKGDLLTTFDDIARRFRVHEIVEGITDFAIGPRESEFDPILVSMSNGLHRLTWDPGLEIWIDVPLDAGGPLGNATHLQVRELDEMSGYFVAGLVGTTIVTGSVVGDALCNVQITPNVVGARDVVAIDWTPVDTSNTGAVFEFAVLTSSWLVVIDAAGNVLSATGASGGRDLIERLPTSSGTDRLLYVVDDVIGQTGQYLFVLDSTGSETPYALPGIAANDIDVGDYDGDGALDFVVTSTSPAEAWIHYGGAGESGHSFGLRSGEEEYPISCLPLTEDPPSPPGPTLLSTMFDADLDGDFDVLAVSATGEVSVSYGTRIFEDALMAILDTTVVSGPCSGEMVFNLEAILTHMAGSLAGFTHVEIDVWAQSATGEEVEFWDNALEPLPNPLPLVIEIPFQIEDECKPQSWIYQLGIRVVRVETIGGVQRIVASRPPLSAEWTNDAVLMQQLREAESPYRRAGLNPSNWPERVDDFNRRGNIQPQPPLFH